MLTARPGVSGNVLSTALWDSKGVTSHYLPHVSFLLGSKLSKIDLSQVVGGIKPGKTYLSVRHLVFSHEWI